MDNAALHLLQMDNLPESDEAEFPYWLKKSRVPAPFAAFQ
jgi:hypothetical protein